MKRKAVDTATAANLLPLSQGTIKRYCREGRIKATKPCGKYLISQEEINRWLAKTKEGKTI